MKGTIIYIIVPLIFTNVFHMLMVKKNLFPRLNIALSSSLFGENKTWRGIFVIIVLNSIFQFIFSLIFPYHSILNSLAFGAILGITYVLFELPNSYIKRRIGIAPGEKAQKCSWLFLVIDKCDSALGISLVGSLIFSLTFLQGFQLFYICVLTHILFSLLLVSLKVKKRY